MKLHIWRWHSVNLIPAVWLGSMYYDELDQEQGQVIEITIFGLIINIDFPCQKPVYWDTGVHGPLWSRKLWYQAPRP